MTKTTKTLINITTLSLVLISLACFPFNIKAQEEIPLHAPKDLEEIQEFGEGMLEASKEQLPDIMKRLWNEDVMPLWQKMYDWFDLNVGSKFKEVFDEEVEKRKPVVEQEYEKEKEEVKEELPIVTQSIWERLLELWGKEEEDI